MIMLFHRMNHPLSKTNIIFLIWGQVLELIAVILVMGILGITKHFQAMVRQVQIKITEISEQQKHFKVFFINLIQIYPPLQENKTKDNNL